MKKTRFFAMCVAALALALSCQKEADVDSDAADEALLDLSERSLSYSYEGGSDDIKVTANKEGWTFGVIEGDDSWCHLTAEGKTIHVVVDENKNQIERSTVLTVKLEDVTKRVRIEQAAAPAP